MIVLLRVGIGWQFLYEGYIKFDPAANFSAESLLGFAKGPPAEMFYWMLPDIDGIERLAIAEVESGRTNADGNPMLVDGEPERVPTFIVYENAWREFFKDYLMRHFPSISVEDAEAIIGMDFIRKTQLARWLRQKELLTEQEAERIGSLRMTVAAEVARISEWVRETAATNEDIEQFSEWLEQNEWISAVEAERIIRANATRIARMNASQFSEWIRETVIEDDENAGDAAERLAKAEAFIAATEAINKARAIVAAKRIFARYITSLRADASDEKEDVDAFIGSRERFIEHRGTVPNNATFEQERHWWQMIGYRSEAGYWTRKFNQLGNSMQSELGRVIDLQLAGSRGEIVTAPERELIPSHPILEQLGIQYTIPPNSCLRSRMEVMNLGVTIFLTAIGLCLILGFCTRLACLAGIAFLINVLLVTWPVPGVYPPIPMVAGSAMVVSKDMVGLLAMSVLVMVPAGRWGGLDYFLWNYGGKQIAGLFCPCSCSKEKTNA